MKRNIATKGLFYCSALSILWLIYQSLTFTKYNNYIIRDELNFQTNRVINNKSRNEVTVTAVNYNVTKYEETVTTVIKLKYILQWTSPTTVPFVYMGSGRNGFVERNCSFTNCFVTANKSYLGDYTNFDLIAFAAPEVRFLSQYGDDNVFPTRRSPHQKFVLASIESADNYPICTKRFDGFFNWTWTYRLDSEAKWGYMAIRDSKNNIIGPKTEMHWIKLEDMDPVSEEVKNKLRNKTKAAAWFVSNCRSRSKREIFFRDLERWLAKYDLQIDVYGECGTMSCSRDNEELCDKMIEEDYYFYLSFENSFAEDYVTEKLLHALRNYAIPIVYGGANYSRFMPDGIYLNGRELGAAKVAQRMNELIENPDLYAEYFRWKKYYSYHRRFESEETEDYCRFCSILNEEDKVKSVSIYENFKEWWNPPNRC